MIVTITEIKKPEIGSFGLKFNFELENDDKRETISNNIGGAKIVLAHEYCHFYFPFKIEIPHADLLAWTALKIISPYIGKRLVIKSKNGEGVSEEFAEFATQQYKGIYFKVDPEIDSFKNSLSKKNIAEPKENVISFSGGVDSIAAAFLVGEKVPLILTAEHRHPDLKEGWRVDKAPVETISRMPDTFEKIIIYSDFVFVSVHGRVNPYPDTYSFTISSILLAEHLGIKNILSGDIMDALCWSNTRPTKDFKSQLRNQFKILGLRLDYPCNGISEVVTAKIAYDNNMLNNSSACVWGEFQKPCMKCGKCFRKSLYRWAMFDEKMRKEDIEWFSKNSTLLDRYLDDDSIRTSWAMMPNYKYCFSKIEYKFGGKILQLKKKANLYKYNPNYLEKYHPYAYKDRIEILSDVEKNLQKYAKKMNKKEIDIFDNTKWETYRRKKWFFKK